jgi:hypothetical protein
MNSSVQKNTTSSLFAGFVFGLTVGVLGYGILNVFKMLNLRAFANGSVLGFAIGIGAIVGIGIINYVVNALDRAKQHLG